MDRQEKKNPWGAAFISIFLPGGGHLYCGQYAAGLTVLTLCVGFVVAAQIVTHPFWVEFFQTTPLWAYSVLLFADGWIAADHYNRKLAKRNDAH